MYTLTAVSYPSPLILSLRTNIPLTSISSNCWITNPLTVLEFAQMLFKPANCYFIPFLELGCFWLLNRTRTSDLDGIMFIPWYNTMPRCTMPGCLINKCSQIFAVQGLDKGTNANSELQGLTLCHVHTNTVI